MTKLEQNIERIETELAQMKQELKDSKKFKCKYLRGKTFFIGSTEIINSCSGIGDSSAYNGRYRISKANVDYGLEHNRLDNRL